MLTRSCTETTAVSALAAMVALDHVGRPYVHNLSSSHRLGLRRWPGTDVTWLAKDPGPNLTSVAQVRSQLQQGWWWVVSENSQANEGGWALISVLQGGTHRTGPIPQGAGPGGTDPPARLVKPVNLDRADIEVLVRYFLGWLSLPPDTYPRVSTAADALDSSEAVRSRLIRKIGPTPAIGKSVRGMFTYELLKHACQSGSLTFEQVHQALGDMDLL